MSYIGSSFLIYLLIFLLGSADFKKRKKLKIEQQFSSWKKRSEEVIDISSYFDLADFVDFIILSLASGLTLPRAYKKALSSLKEGEIKKAAREVIKKNSVGCSFSESLFLSHTSGSAKVFDDFLDQLLLSLEMGSDTIRSLDTFSSSLRDEASRYVEEEAMKVPVKMLFPLAVFFLPVIFLVLLGAAIHDLLDIAFSL